MLEKTEINIIRLQENIKKEFYLWNEIQDHEDQGGQGNERRIFYYHGILKDIDQQIRLIKDNNGNSSRISKYEQEQQIIWKLYHQLVDKPRHHPVNASSISISTPLKDPQPSISSKSSEITNKNNEKQKKSSISEENRFHNQDITSASTITSLLMKQKDISIKEIDDEKDIQRNIINELTELTSILKENTIAMSESVRDQNMKLDVIHKYAEENVDELNNQKKHLTKQSKSQKMNFLTTIWMIVSVFLVFIGTYMVIRLFPKP